MEVNVGDVVGLGDVLVLGEMLVRVEGCGEVVVKVKDGTADEVGVTIGSTVSETSDITGGVSVVAEEFGEGAGAASEVGLGVVSISLGRGDAPSAEGFGEGDLGLAEDNLGELDADLGLGEGFSKTSSEGMSNLDRGCIVIISGTDDDSPLDGSGVSVASVCVCSSDPTTLSLCLIGDTSTSLDPSLIGDNSTIIVVSVSSLLR